MQRRIAMAKYKAHAKPPARMRAQPPKRVAAPEEEEDTHAAPSVGPAAQRRVEKRARASEEPAKPEVKAGAPTEGGDDAEVEVPPLEELEFEDPITDEERDDTDEEIIDHGGEGSSDDEPAGLEGEEGEEAAEDDDEDDEDDGKMDMGGMKDALDETEKKLRKKLKQEKGKEVFKPGKDKLEEGETLECDPSAYEMLHTFELEWPALSFDVMHDELGMQRSKFPHTMTFAVGSQADKSKQNKITLLKVSKLYKTKKADDDDDDEDSDRSDNESEDSDLDEDPILESRTVPHTGAINRIRCMPQNSSIMATWADTGRACVWDLASFAKALETPSGAQTPRPSPAQVLNHSTEGYAMDWNPSQRLQGSLITGDCSGAIHLWTPAKPSWVHSGPYTGHSRSVEDLQWSPRDETVFASCSADCTIRLWDTRTTGKSLTTVIASGSDVNVISWNKKAPHLLVSGADDGAFRVWDLRNFKDNSPITQFTWHEEQITSVEWSPHDESVVAVASADDSLSIWDLSLEADAEVAGNDEEVEAPSQLLFLHMGQKHIKELHWHPQIPGVIISTALDGINVFKPAYI